MNKATKRLYNKFSQAYSITDKEIKEAEVKGGVAELEKIKLWIEESYTPDKPNVSKLRNEIIKRLAELKEKEVK